MIILKIDGETYEINKEEFEQAIVTQAIPQLKEATGKMGMMKGTLDSTLGGVLAMLGMGKPKDFSDMDNMEYAGRLALAIALDGADGKTLNLPSAKKVVEEVKADE